MSFPAAPARYPHADLWTLGILFVLSRMNWMISLHYHSSSNATGSVVVSLAGGLSLVLLGYALARVMRESVFAHLARAMVLAMWTFFIVVNFHQFLVPGVKVSAPWQALIAVAGLASTFGIAYFLVPVWERLRAALLAAALICAFSPFVLVALLAPRVELLAAPGQEPRPVVVLVLDEFSAGAAQGLMGKLEERQLQVEAWSVPSIGKNTIDVIPAMWSGGAIPDARTCTAHAVCGRGGAVDLARLSVVRGDVDVVGLYHPYCVIAGLRSCVMTHRGRDEMPVAVVFLCALPVKVLLEDLVGCNPPPPPGPRPERLASAEKAIDEAPFWTKGGILYAHVLIPHPPGLGGEPRLEDAYAANVKRAEQFVLGILDRFERTAMRDGFSLIITSDHALRMDYWCVTQPFATHGCEVPAPMRTTEVPFFVATRGRVAAHRIPRSNLDLLPITAELAGPR